MVSGPVTPRRKLLGKRLAAVGAALSIPIAASGRAAATTGVITHEKVALTGDQAPGTAPGVVFSAFTGPYTHPEPGPRIDAQGRVGFFALITGPGVTAENHSGIWSQTSGTLGLEARAGVQVPGAAAGVTFRAFTEDFAPSTPLIGEGRIGFAASLTGSGVTGANGSGIWTRNAGGIELLARMGSPAPGTGAGIVFTEPLYLFDASDAGHMLVSGRLSGPGTSDANGDGFWSNRSGPLSLILREGQQAPGLPAGVVFGSGQFIGSPYPFPIVRFNEASQLVVQGNLLGPGVNTFNNEAWFAERGGQLRLIAREGDPAPGFPGSTLGGDSVVLQTYALSFNDLGQVAFDVMLGGSQSGMTVLYSDHRGSLLPVARPYDPAPGSSGKLFGLLVGPTLSDGGHIAFRASFSDAGQWPPFGIWWDQTGPLTALVIPGQQVPGLSPGATFVGAQYIDGFNAAGQMAFRAEISEPGANPNMALFLTEADGSLRLLARAGAAFDVAGDGSDVRTVHEITTGGLSENGVVAFRLDFENGTSGIFTASLAAGPPGSAGGLMLEKSAGGYLDLTWSQDCGGGSHYGIYRGDLAAGLSSMSAVTGFCAVGGTSASIPAGSGSAEFFLVVPSVGGFEGSYGTDSAGISRPPALLPCHPRDQVDSCQP